MKRNVVLLFLLITSVSFGQEIKFKDSEFKKQLFEEYQVDSNGDGKIDQQEVRDIKSLELSGVGIQYLENLKYFPNLELLHVSGNAIKTIDLSKNTKLKVLYIDSNQLEELDLSKNIALVDLSCAYNKISAFDFSQNPNLRLIHINGNFCIELDFSNNKKLEYLSVSDNKQLKKINVSNNRILKGFRTSYTQLEVLDVSKNPLLTELLCGKAQLKFLDVSKIKNLEVLAAYENPQLKCIKVSNWFSAKNNDDWSKDEHTKYSVHCD